MPMALHCAWKTWRGSSWSASFYGVDARLNGATMTPIIINQQPGANALETANSVRATMEDLAERFPPGLEYVTPYDTTLFIDASVETVLKTFIEAFLIVIVILFIFLQNWRFTVIAMSVVPVSVIGTFAGFYLFDFSINLLTLFALVLSIGIVVDDAILVVENVERVLSEEDDISVRDATIRAMKEVGGPVIATSLIMAAVFVPVAFMGGFTGQIYQQFAITVAISVALSALMALTFTPALSAIFIKHNLHKTRQSAFKRAITTPLRLFDRFFAGFTALYMWFVKKLVRFCAGAGADCGSRGGLLLAVCQYALDTGARDRPGDRAGEYLLAGCCLAEPYPGIHGGAERADRSDSRGRVLFCGGGL